MASIPLPALSIRPPQEQEGPLQQYAQVLGIKNQMQQQQQNALALKQQQQSLDDQQAMTKAMQSWDGKDAQQLIQGVIKNGGSANAVMGLQQKVLGQKETYSKIAQQDAETGSKNIATQKEKADAVLGVINGLKQLPDEQLQQAVTEKVQQMTQQGLIDPNSVGQIKQLAQGDPATIRQHLDTFGKLNSFQSQQLESAGKQATIDKDKAQQLQATAETNKINQDLSYGPSGAAAEAKYRFILSKGANASPEDQQWAKSFRLANTKTTTTSDSLGIKSVSTNGPSGVSPAGAVTGGGVPVTAGASSLIDEIGQGKMTAARMEMLIARRPELVEAVAAKYPDFDGSKIKSYTDAYKSFTSGADAKQVNAGAVAMQHLAELKKLNDDNPTQVRIMGTDAYNRFHNLLDTVADELVTFYGEPKTNEAMDAKKSTLGAFVNRDGAIQEQAKAMGVKFDELEQKWQNAAPSAAYQAPMPNVSKNAMKARASLDSEYAARLNEKSAAAEPTSQPAPQTHTFSVSAWQKSNPKGNPAQAVAAAKAAGYQVAP